MSKAANVNEIIRWLLYDSDPALERQVRRDLLSAPPEEIEALKRSIPRRGWVKALLDERKPDGQWGNSVYNPKWTCTHYVLYELVQLDTPDDLEACKESAALLLAQPRGLDGGVNYARTVKYSDVCINGMILTTVCHFGLRGGAVEEIVDYLLKVRMSDGGWNCEYLHGAVRSSLHTTIAVIEGLGSWLRSGFGAAGPRGTGGRGKYGAGGRRRGEAERALAGGVEFILRHELCKSERTGEIIKDEFFKFCFPVRWKYDILRCLDLFRKLGLPFDPRMDEALEIVRKAAGKSGRWKAASQPGKTYFAVEKNGSESKWNTLRALRVLARYGPQEDTEKKK